MIGPLDPATLSPPAQKMLSAPPKLQELAARGITAIYLNPIFAAPSNHRYDAYDYLHIDPHLGGDEAFDRLVQEAKANLFTARKHGNVR